MRQHGLFPMPPFEEGQTFWDSDTFWEVTRVASVDVADSYVITFRYVAGPGDED